MMATLSTNPNTLEIYSLYCVFLIVEKDLIQAMAKEG